MATVVDALLITMGLDTKGVQKGMQQAQSAISSGVKGIMGLLGPLAGGFAFKSLMDNYVKTADTLGKTANRIGVSVTALDSWGMAAQHAGGSSEAFQSSLESLNAGLQNLVANGGKGKLAAPLAALGVSAVDAAGKTKEPIALLKELAAVAGKMDKAKFAGIASKLGLDKGTIALLQQGDAEVEKLVKDMEGLAYTDEDAQVAANFGDVVQDLGRAFSKVAAVVMREAVPALTWIAEKVTALAKLLSSNKVAMAAVFIGIAAAIMSKVIPALRAFGIAWMTNPATLVITAIVAGITLLLLLLDDIRVWMSGGDSLIGDFLGPWPEFIDRAKQWFSDLWEGIKEKAEALWNWLKTAPGEAIDAVVEWFSGLGDRIGEAWEGLKATLAEAWESIKTTVSDLGGQIVDSIVGAFQNLFNEGKRIFQELWDWIVNLFKNIGEAIWGGIKSVGSKIGGAIGGAWDSFKGLFGGGDAAAKDVGAGMAATGDVAAGAAAGGSTTTVDNSSETNTYNISVSEAAPGTGGQQAAQAAKSLSEPAASARKASGSIKG